MIEFIARVVKQGGEWPTGKVTNKELLALVGRKVKVRVEVLKE